MKTTTKISVIAYDMELVDLRTKEHVTDTIVLERSWLEVLHKMGLSDHDMLCKTYSERGYYLLKMNTRRKVSLSVDLEQLYSHYANNEGKSQTYGILEVAAND